MSCNIFESTLFSLPPTKLEKDHFKQLKQSGYLDKFEKFSLSKQSHQSIQLENSRSYIHGYVLTKKSRT